MRPACWLRSVGPADRPARDDEEQERRLDHVDPGNHQRDDQRQGIAERPARSSSRRREGKEDEPDATDQARNIVTTAGEPGETARQQDHRHRRGRADEGGAHDGWRMDDRLEGVRVGTDQRGRDDRNSAEDECNDGGQPLGHDRRIEGRGYPPDLMTWRRRANGGLAALLTIALIAGCDATVPPATPSGSSALAAPSTPGSPIEAPSGSPGTVEVEVPPARWSDCGKGFLCADIRVPRDYDDPTAGYLTVALVRLSATEPKDRIGSLLINPGGPGASGVEFVRSAGGSGVFPAALRKRFDIVGFDPRGVNVSSGIRCIDNLDPQARLDPSPDDPEELEKLVGSARAYAAECAKRNEATLPYLSTDSVAQDLDVIRQALGDEMLTYLGFSYGTLIGSSYAERFPDRIRAMVLDGAIDPSLDLEHLRAGQANGFEKALTSFLDDCAAKIYCAFYEKGKSVAAFDALMASIEAKPLPARLDRDGRQVGPFVASFAVLAALYDWKTWPDLASSLELAKSGDGSLLLQIADPYQGRKPNGSYSNQHDAYTANVCLDFAAPTDVATYTDWAKRLATSAPHFAGLIAYNDLACSFWPVPAQRVPGPVTAAGAPPILVIGTTGDPATRYVWAERLADELESGVLITNEGDSHTAYLTSSCVQRAVNAYLLGLTVPKPGLTCQ